MTTLLACTDSQEINERITGYLTSRVRDGYRVVALNSLRGGQRTSSEEVKAGEEAGQATVDPLLIDR